MDNLRDLLVTTKAATNATLVKLMADISKTTKANAKAITDLLTAINKVH